MFLPECRTVIRNPELRLLLEGGLAVVRQKVRDDFELLEHGQIGKAAAIFVVAAALINCVKFISALEMLPMSSFK